MTAFRDIYGHTLKIKVLEYLIENRATGFSVGDMSKELKMSRPKAYEIIAEFLKGGYILKHRMIGRTQLYVANEDNIIIKIHIRNYEECIKMVIDEYRPKTHSSTSSVGVASAKGR